MHASPRPRRQLGRAVHNPPRALGVIAGGGLAVWAALAAMLVFTTIAGKPADIKTFLGWTIGSLLVLAAIAFGWWAYCLATLSYSIDRTSLSIRWGPRTIRVPIQSIERMVPGRTLDIGPVRGLNWWGCHIGRANVRRIGETLTFSTHRQPDEVLYIVTTYGAFALTVINQAAFAEDIQARAAVAPVQPSHRPRTEVSGFGPVGLAQDRGFIASTTVSIIICGVLAGYVFAKYPGLPGVIELHFPALGGIVRVGDKAELLNLVYAGLAILVGNVAVAALIHTRERAASLWLVASGGMLQAILLGAAITAIQRS